MLFVKFTYDYYKNANNELRIKETLLAAWNELIKSKQQITLCIKNLPSVPICICSHNNNNFLVFCDACKYWYHTTCMHVKATFNSSLPFDFYVCPCCIFCKFGSFSRYLSLSSVTLTDGNKETLKNAFINWKSKSEKIKKIWSHIKNLIHQFSRTFRRRMILQYYLKRVFLTIIITVI